MRASFVLPALQVYVSTAADFCVTAFNPAEKVQVRSFPNPWRGRLIFTTVLTEDSVQFCTPCRTTKMCETRSSFFGALPLQVKLYWILTDLLELAERTCEDNAGELDVQRVFVRNRRVVRLRFCCKLTHWMGSASECAMQLGPRACQNIKRGHAKTWCQDFPRWPGQSA